MIENLLFKNKGDKILRKSEPLKLDINLPQDLYSFLKRKNPVPDYEGLKEKIKDEEVKNHLMIGYFVGDYFFNVSYFYEIDKILNSFKYSNSEGHSLKLVKIGDNNIPEGGIYFGFGEKNKNQIFSFHNSPEYANDKEQILVANTFSDLLNSLKIFYWSFEEETEMC